MKKFFLVWLMFFILLAPAVASAADPNLLTPAFNPICWQAKQCADVRALYGADSKSSGWLEKEDPCNESGWGKCLPVGKSITEISFGGIKDFANIGEFIKINYKLALTIAEILAIIMIIVAGIQWVTSGGNSEMITSAKKRISGAMVGLMIAYLSYTILTTINPAMVNLRLPQAFMIRPQVVGSAFCNAMPNGTKFAKAADVNQEIPADAYSKVKDFPLVYDAKDTKKVVEDFKCGKKLFFDSGSGQTCLGQACPEFQICLDTGNKKYQCQYGLLAGNITGHLGPFGAPVVDNPDLVNTGSGVKLMMICNNGYIKTLAGIFVDEGKFLFGTTINGSNSKIQILDQITNAIASGKCGDEPGKKPTSDQDYRDRIAGFYIGLEVNDESGLTGKLGEGFIGSWGVDDWHAVGKTAEGNCSYNLSRHVLKILAQDSQCNDSSSHVTCSCSTLDATNQMKDILKSGSDKRTQFLSHLIWYDQLFGADKKGGGYNCNINIIRPGDPPEFPAVDNSLASKDWSIGWGALTGVGATFYAEKYVFNVVSAFANDPTDCDSVFNPNNVSPK